MSIGLISSLFIHLILNWNTFIAEDSKFKVSVPAPMEVKSKTMETEIGTITSYSYFINDKEEDTNNYLYLVNHFEYPPALVHSDSLSLVQDLLNESMEGLLVDNAAKLSYQDNQFYKNYPGQFFRMENEEAVIKVHLYIIENHFYSLQVYMLKKHALNDDANRFLKSFQFID
jgi:hypothetical protein